jgi:hypothetical protein
MGTRSVVEVVRADREADGVVCEAGSGSISTEYFILWSTILVPDERGAI